MADLSPDDVRRAGDRPVEQRVLDGARVVRRDRDRHVLRAIDGTVERLREAGLVSVQTGMDNPRNVIGCDAHEEARLAPGFLLFSGSGG